MSLTSEHDERNAVEETAMSSMESMPLQRPTCPARADGPSRTPSGREVEDDAQAIDALRQQYRSAPWTAAAVPNPAYGASSTPAAVLSLDPRVYGNSPGKPRSPIELQLRL